LQKPIEKLARWQSSDLQMGDLLSVFRWKDLQSLALVGQLGLVIIGPALVGIWLGSFLANYVGHALVLVVVGMLLGLIGGAMRAYKILMKK